MILQRLPKPYQSMLAQRRAGPKKGKPDNDILPQGLREKACNAGSTAVMAVAFIIALRRKKASTVIQYGQEEDGDYPTT
jgi:hypothetical protein